MNHLICKIWLLAAVVAGGFGSVYGGGEDWRSDGSSERKMENLVRLVPGASHWMMEMGQRYQNLYWAAKLEKWEFAAYQAEEIEGLVKQLALARPKRAATAEIFQQNMFPMLHEEIAKKSWSEFQTAFRRLHSECMACHVREDHAFVVLPIEPKSAASPVLNLD